MSEHTSSPPPADLRLAPSFLVSVGVVGVLLLMWIFHLWPQWSTDPELSHGLLTPFFFGALLFEARTRGTARFFSPTPRLRLARGAVLLCAVLGLGIAGLYAAALDWSHALVNAVLAVALTALLGGVLLTSAQTTVGCLPFNWQSCAAVLLWTLSAPLPPGTYARLSQSLQTAVAEGVLVTLHFLGIAAVRSGNVIDLPRVSVGIEEACSGIRSLVSCVFVGLFLSATVVRGWARRGLLLLSAAPLAVLMNFARSLLLTLLAHAGVDISGRWHDLTGYGVLIATAALLGAMAFFLNAAGGTHRRPTAPARDQGPPPALHTAPHGPVSRAQPLLLSSVCATAALIGVFALTTRSSPTTRPAPPALAEILPGSLPGWDVTTREDLYRFSSQLQTDHLFERTYTRADAAGLVQVTVYAAYWVPGQAPVSLVASHTPEACWPGSGWQEDRAAHRRVATPLAGAQLPDAEYRRFELEGYPQHVWYWHLYDSDPVRHEGVGSPARLLSLAWHYGFRRGGEQVFIRVSSNRAWEAIDQDVLGPALLKALRDLGLKPGVTAAF